jgi:hypothetical protein
VPELIKRKSTPGNTGTGYTKEVKHKGGSRTENKYLYHKLKNITGI